MMRRVWPLVPAWINVTFDFTVLFLAALMGGLIGSWLFDRSPPIELLNRKIINFTIDPSKPACRFSDEGHKLGPCSDLVYDNTFIRVDFCDTLVNRWVLSIDGQMFPMSDVPAAMPTTGLNSEETRRVAISMRDMALIDGIYYFQFRSSWSCNPIHKWFHWPIRGEIETISFIVHRQ